MSIPYVADEEEWDSLIVREQTSPLLRTWGTFAVSPWQNGLYKPITNHFLHLGWRSTNNYVKEGVNGCTSVVVPMHRAFLVYMASHNFTHACTRPLRVYGSLFLLSRKKRCNSKVFSFFLHFFRLLHCKVANHTGLTCTRFAKRPVFIPDSDTAAVYHQAHFFYLHFLKHLEVKEESKRCNLSADYILLSFRCCANVDRPTWKLLLPCCFKLAWGLAPFQSF